jgi:hypothetical protein
MCFLLATDSRLPHLDTPFDADFQLARFEASLVTSAERLTSIRIHRSVESIGERSFYECERLSSVTVESESKLSRIGDLAFVHSRETEWSFTVRIEFQVDFD